MSTAVLCQLCYMLFIAALSFVFARRNGFGHVQSAFASRLLLYFVNPCLIVYSFTAAYSAERMKGLALSAAVSLVLHLVFTAIVTFARPKRKGQEVRASLDRVGIVFTNCGFIGIPLINGVLGGEAVFYLMGYIAVFNVYLWIYGARETGAPAKPLNIITNPNVIAVILGIVIFCLPTIPAAWTKPLAYISDANTPLSMILLGMLFAEYIGARGNGRESTGVVRNAAIAAVLRMAVLPLAAAGIAAAVWRFAPHTETVHTVLMVCCIAAACPVGMSVSSLACVFCEAKGKGEEIGGVSPSAYSSLLVLSTSALSVFTIPLLVHLAEILMQY